MTACHPAMDETGSDLWRLKDASQISLKHGVHGILPSHQPIVTLSVKFAHTSGRIALKCMGFRGKATRCLRVGIVGAHPRCARCHFLWVAGTCPVGGPRSPCNNKAIDPLNARICGFLKKCGSCSHVSEISYTSLSSPCSTAFVSLLGIDPLFICKTHLLDNQNFDHNHSVFIWTRAHFCSAEQKQHARVCA